MIIERGFEWWYVFGINMNEESLRFYLIFLVVIESIDF